MCSALVAQFNKVEAFYEAELQRCAKFLADKGVTAAADGSLADFSTTAWNSPNPFEALGDDKTPKNLGAAMQKQMAALASAEQRAIQKAAQAKALRAKLQEAQRQIEDLLVRMRKHCTTCAGSSHGLVSSRRSLDLGDGFVKDHWSLVGGATSQRQGEGESPRRLEPAITGFEESES